MKVFKKVFAFAIALTAIAMASSVMAENGTATYTDHKIKVDDIERASGQTTVAVVTNTFDGTNSDDIYYIDQDEASVIEANLKAGVGLKAKDESFVASALQVRVGGGDEIEVFDVPAVQYDDSYKSQTPEKKPEDGKTDIYRIGLEGKFQMNGGTVNKITFVLKAAGEGHDTDKYSNTALVDTGTVEFSGDYGSISGEVTFGLEIANVPENVTITLDSVTAE